jgi:hypothetical protein
VFGDNIFAKRINRLENDLENVGTDSSAWMVREGRI